MQLKLIAAILILITVTIMTYKVEQIGLPLSPDEKSTVWSIQARVSFNAKGGPVKLRLNIPYEPPGFVILHEDFVASHYGLAKDQAGANRQAIWSVRRAKDRQVLYYRASLIPAEAPPSKDAEKKPEYPDIPNYGEPMGAAVDAILTDARSRSADVLSFTRELLATLNENPNDENVSIINQNEPGSDAWVRTVIDTLAGARIPARIVYVLPLKDRVSHDQVEPWIEVHNDYKWTLFNPMAAQAQPRDSVLIWSYHEPPIADIMGGDAIRVDFSIAQQLQNQLVLAHKQSNFFTDYSLLNLPIHTQNVYRIVLLLPLCALVIVFIRTFIGFETFGTFMPVLISLAFRETQLLWGIILFSTVVAIGLGIRLYFEQLKLLLVPRLAAVLTLVIILITWISVLSAQLELERGLSVALFPIVILAMTIERATLIWEEHGPNEVIRRGLGTLVAASLGYLIISNQWLEHLVFTFPELLLSVLAFTLLVGRYTGYRLMEVWRFRHLIWEKRS